MGERSQIFIKTNYTDKEGNTETKLYAIYYQWNYNERMISRMKSLAEWIKDEAGYIYMPDVQKKLELVAKVNFDMMDVMLTSDLIKEAFECNDYKMIENDDVFNHNDNNHGQGFIELDYDDLSKESQVYYCFREQGEESPMDALQYLMWDNSHRLSDIAGLEEEDSKICRSLPEMFAHNLPRLLSVYSLEEAKDIIPALCDNVKYLNDECKLMNGERLKNFLNADYSRQFKDAQKSTILDNLFFYQRRHMEHPEVDFTDRINELKDIWDKYEKGTLDEPTKEEEELDR